jgi:phage-related minor tail protein
MIERNDYMPDKKLTTEELIKQVEEAKKTFEHLNEQLQKQKKEEEERKRAELALQKENRKKEVEVALHNYHTLLRAYIEDYGYFSSTMDATTFSDLSWPWWV